MARLLSKRPWRLGATRQGAWQLVISLGLLGLLVHASALGQVQIEGVTFYYKPDAEARYLKRRDELQLQRPLPLTRVELATLAMAAHQESRVEKTLTVWREQGGSNPWIFYAKIHVMNPTDTPLMGERIRVKTRAHLGELRTDAQAYITLYSHLEKTAQWIELDDKTLDVPLLNAGEEALVATPALSLLDLLARYPLYFPAQIEVSAQPGDGSLAATSTGTLRLIPSHFVIPDIR